MALILELYILAGSRRLWFVTFSKFYQQKESLKKNKFISKWPLKKIENTPIIPNFNTDPSLTSKLILEGSHVFCFYNEYISLQIKETFKRSILEKNYSNFGLKMILQAKNFASSLALNFINLSWFSYKKAVICHMSKVLSSNRVFLEE